VHALESSSGRSALHKAAYWGHEQLTAVLLREYKLDPNVQDHDGDTALHDAARYVLRRSALPSRSFVLIRRFGHVKVCTHLLSGGCNKDLRNKAGKRGVQSLHLLRIFYYRLLADS
jgi:ankyrin repeat protein